MSKVEVDVNRLARERMAFNLTVSLTGLKAFRARLWLGVLLLRLASVVLPAPAQVEVK
jgi:hypothetical protein